MPDPGRGFSLLLLGPQPPTVWTFGLQGRPRGPSAGPVAAPLVQSKALCEPGCRGPSIFSTAPCWGHPEEALLGLLSHCELLSAL